MTVSLSFDELSLCRAISNRAAHHIALWVPHSSRFWLEWVNISLSLDELSLCSAMSNRAAHPVFHLAIKLAFLDSVMIASVNAGVTHNLVFPRSRH